MIRNVSMCFNSRVSTSCLIVRVISIHKIIVNLSFINYDNFGVMQVMVLSIEAIYKNLKNNFVILSKWIYENYEVIFVLINFSQNPVKHLRRSFLQK